jgi:hypothetical protein
MTRIGPVPAEWGPRVRPTLLAIGCAFGTYALLSAGFCSVGATYEGPLRMLEPYRAPSIDEAAALIPMEYALTQGDANDVVFVGDSTCRTGIDPRLFEKLSDLRAYNLGSSGALGISGQLSTVKAYLAHHPAPRVVVLCMSPTQVLRVQSSSLEIGNGTSAGAISERFLRVFGSPSQRRGIFADGTKSIRYFINRGMAISKGSVSDFLKGQAPDRLNEPLYGLETEAYRTLSDKTRQRRGFFPLPRDHLSGVPMFAEMLEEPHSVNPWIDEGVRAFAELAQSHSFRLLIRLTPLPPDKAPWDRECIAAWLKVLEARFPNVSDSPPEILWYERDFFWDLIHLNGPGVERFTTKTAAEVTGLLGSQRVTAAHAAAPENGFTEHHPARH